MRFGVLKACLAGVHNASTGGYSGKHIVFRSDFVRGKIPKSWRYTPQRLYLDNGAVCEVWIAKDGGHRLVSYGKNLPFLAKVVF